MYIILFWDAKVNVLRPFSEDQMLDLAFDVIRNRPQFTAAVAAWMDLIGISFLRADMKEAYKRLPSISWKYLTG